MNANKDHKPTMYETISAVAALNKVQGFEPLKFLRRSVSQKGAEEVLKLDLRYKKLWFRLAHPHGRLKLNALRITEQLAIYEAMIFLDRSDTEPVSSYTATCTRDQTPDGKYVEAAQKAALDEALSDAGFGLQFADVSVGKKEENYGSEIPLSGTSVIQKTVSAAQELPDAPVATTVAEEDENAPDAEEISCLPTEKTAEMPVSEEIALPADKPIEDMNEEQKAASDISEAVQSANADPATDISESASGTDLAKYAEMPLEEILRQMTFEEAQSVYVNVGICNGWTMAQVAERRAPSLKWYVYGYKGDDNIIRAAAQIMLDSLSVQKAS